MNKREYSEETKKILLALEGKVPNRLYRNLWEMHVALYARALAEEYPTYGKTFRLYCSVQMNLARDYDKIGECNRASKYRLAIVRSAARLLKKKEGK